MNYYEHHLGDWAAATGHLTWDEDMAYTRLLRAYYHHEKAIPDGQQYRLAKAAAPAQRRAVDQVLAEFFELREGAFYQKRADAEIGRYQDKQRKAKASADARWAHTERNANALPTHDIDDRESLSASRKDRKAYKTAPGSAGPGESSKSLILNDLLHANAMRTHSEGNALQSPDTRPNLKPSNLTVAPALPSEDRPPPPPQLSLVEAPQPKPKGLPDCPHVAVLALWAETLPAMPQHLQSQWKGTRAAHLRARWRETAAEKGWADEAQGLAYLRKLFGYVGQSAFLTGRARPRGDGRPFVAELEWLVNPTNWAKVHEGKYHSEAA